MTGVNGWYSANHAIAVGSESVGTKPLPRNCRKVMSSGELLAVSGDFAFRPKAAPSQISARLNAASSPAAASH